MVFGGKSVSFKPEKDIPSLDGKVVLVTGGNIGLGKQSVLEFARHGPAQIWLAARSLDKAKAAADEIKQQVPNAAPIRLLELDLSSFESVKKAAATFSAESDRLDILMLNAGIMAAPPGMTKDGYEIQFGTNHMGHALLTKLLLPTLEKTAKSDGSADVRIVSLSSHGHIKLANILWARQMAKLYPQFTTAAIHPGVVKTNLMVGATGSPLIIRILGKVAYSLLTPVEQGARNQLWASVSKDVKSGEYYEPVGVGDLVSANGKDDNLMKKIWDWTEKELEGHVA
ncbi:NAD(P)-binding protein [Glonium stellatum]|uniref:NAD(P)-binding protein n=1 Tax=Glonium stellatum TaxID=574774 RepID=A0A8E2FBW6_9PEZI|nr:NAD(P)-binding protein [Glonium stellatum]